MNYVSEKMPREIKEIKVVLLFYFLAFRPTLLTYNSQNSEMSLGRIKENKLPRKNIANYDKIELLYFFRKYS